MTDRRPAPPSAPAKKMVPCPACTGRGVVSCATEDVECSTCKGTGKVAA